MKAKTLPLMDGDLLRAAATAPRMCCASALLGGSSARRYVRYTGKLAMVSVSASVRLMDVKSRHFLFFTATRSSARLSMLTSLAMLNRSTWSLLS